MATIKKRIIDKNGKTTHVHVRTGSKSIGDRLSKALGVQLVAPAGIQFPEVDSGYSSDDGGMYSSAQVEAYFPAASDASLIVRNPELGYDTSVLVMRSQRIRFENNDTTSTPFEIANNASEAIGKEVVYGKDAKSYYLNVVENVELPLLPAAEDIRSAYESVELDLEDLPNKIGMLQSATGLKLKIDRVK